MPFRKRLERWKNEFKDRLGLTSPGGSSPSLPNTRQPSPIPIPQTSQRSATPLPNAAADSAQIDAGSQLLSPPTDPVPSQALATMIPSVPPSPVSESHLLVPVPLAPLDPSQSALSIAATKTGGMKSTTWSGLEALLKVLDASADIFPPLKSAVGGLSQCIEIFERASKGREEYDQLRTKLNLLLQDLGQFFDGSTPPTVTTSMKNLAIGLNEELRLVQQKYASRAVRRHEEALEDSDAIMDCYRRIAGHFERLTLNSNLTIWRIVDEQATESRLRQLVPKLSAIYDSAESEDVKRGPCTPGTRLDEIAQLLTWAHDREAEDVYWINGMAGTGKTTISYSVCAKLAQKMELGASFFCSRLIPECRDVKLILPAIAYQLARFSRPFRCALLRVLEADPDVHTRVLKTQFESLLAKPLLEVEHTLPADFVVVIDALDECENKDGVGRILEVLLMRHNSSRLPVRFLVSTRPEPNIYFRMMKRTGNNADIRLVLHELDAKNVKRDIETYLQVELDGVHLKSSQLAALVEHSGVLFIYAATAARYIKDGHVQDEHEERLGMLLGLSPASPNGKDRDIDLLYSTILQAAFGSKGSDEVAQTRMKFLLHTVICAQEPLTVVGLTGLLKMKSAKQVDALLRPLCSVLNIAETTGLVTTLHASFPDFMLNPHRAVSFYCNPTFTHEQLARSCFEAINAAKPEFNICGLESSYTPDENVSDLVQRVEQVVSSHLWYACQHWIGHLDFVGRSTDLDLQLNSFLSVRLLLWMEVLSLKKSMQLGPGIIQRAESWSRTDDCSHELTELVHDAWRFVTMFTSHAVSRSTPHIYTSMLLFWPESSPIAQHYKRHIRSEIMMQGTALARRQLSLLATWSFNSAVGSACFSPDGSLIAFGVVSSVFVIDSTTGRTVVGPLGHDDSVTSVTFSPNGGFVASGSRDKTIRVWNIQNGQSAVAPITGHTKEVDSVSFSPDGMRIVSGSADDTVRVWDLQTQKTVTGPLECGALNHSVCFSLDGTRIVSTSWGSTLKAWDAHNGQLVIDEFRGHADMVTSACYSATNNRIASGSWDNTIRVWSAQDGQSIGSPLKGHSDHVLSVAFSPDGKRIVSGSNDKTIRLWDLTSDPISSIILEGHTGPVTSVAFSSDGSCIVSCSDDNTIRVWDVRSRATVADSLEGHTGAVLSVGYSPDGKHIVSGSADTTIRMWDAESGQMVGGPLEGHTDWVRSACFSPDGRRIVSGSDDMTIRGWDVQSGQTVVGSLKGHTKWVLSICLSPDGTLIASGSGDQTIRLWDAQDGKPEGSPLRGHDSYVWSVCFSPNSTCIASGCNDSTILVWDTKSGQTVAGPLKGHTEYVLSVCFSPDGTCLASGSEDKTVRVWDAQRGQAILGPLEGHTGGINSVCFSPNGSLIVSGSEDKTVRLWDARSGQAVGDPLVGHTGPVWSVAFSPDGKHIVSGSEDQTIRVWDVDGILRMYGAADSLPSPSLAPISPPRPHESWVLREDGWVVDREACLLAWVPPDLQHSLIRPCDTLIIGTKGSWEIDLESATLGDSWAECYQPPSS